MVGSRLRSFTLFGVSEEEESNVRFISEPGRGHAAQRNDDAIHLDLGRRLQRAYLCFLPSSSSSSPENLSLLLVSSQHQQS